MASGLLALAALLPGALSRAQAPGAPQPRDSSQDQTQPPAPVERTQPKPIVITPSTPSQQSGGDGTQSSVPGASAPRRPAAAATTPRPGGTKAAQAPTPASRPTKLTSPGLMQLPPGPFNRNVVFIDPAHGGVDSGSHISDSILEKDVSLQLAYKLRSLLAARGFTVVFTRDADAATVSGTQDTALTLDLRAGIGNHARAAACLLLHATAAGRGVHLYSSELTPSAGELFAGPWLTAQAAWVSQSLRLQKNIGDALTRGGVPVVLSRASVRPVDSLTCPAVVVELAPNGRDVSSLNDDKYQQRTAEAIATALLFWQNAAQPPPRLAPPPPPKPTVAPADTTSGTTPATGVQP